MENRWWHSAQKKSRERFFFTKKKSVMLNSRVSDCRNAVPTVRREVHTEYTPTTCMTYIRSVHKHARMWMRACGSRFKMVELYQLWAPERIHLQVSHVTSLLDVATLSHFSRSTARSTTWTARPSQRRHCTPRATSSLSPYQKLQQTQFGRKAALKNHSHTLTMRVLETCATSLPLMSPTSLRPERLRQFRQFLDVLWKTSINYTMYRENLENKINKLQLWKKREELDKFRHKAYSIRRWQKCHPTRRCPTSNPGCTSTSPWKAMRTLISKMERYESCWLHHCVPKERLGDQMQWTLGQWGKCTNVSFIRRSESYRETGYIVFTQTYEKRNHM